MVVNVILTDPEAILGVYVELKLEVFENVPDVADHVQLETPTLTDPVNVIALVPQIDWSIFAFAVTGVFIVIQITLEFTGVPQPLTTALKQVLVAIPFAE